jgi:glutamate racemase
MSSQFLQPTPTAPIGVFDSGIGGLTVVSEISKLLPNEHIIYFGDTCHTPWGDKSRTVIEHYALAIVDFLMQNHCKVIVIACNTASAVATDALQQHLHGVVPVVNVIDPTVEHVVECLRLKKVGLIGTKQTIASRAYVHKFWQHPLVDPRFELAMLATPLLVGLIEEGFTHKDAANLILTEYLQHPNLQGIEALILGCTHYPLLKAQIANFYGQKSEFPIIDSAVLTALKLQVLLQAQQLLTPQQQPGNRELYISDYNPHFVSIAEHFLPGAQLQLCDLWQ